MRSCSPTMCAATFITAASSEKSPRHRVLSALRLCTSSPIVGWRCEVLFPTGTEKRSRTKGKARVSGQGLEPRWHDGIIIGWKQTNSTTNIGTIDYEYLMYYPIDSQTEIIDELPTYDVSFRKKSLKKHRVSDAELKEAITAAEAARNARGR